jgi:hypothetical protein
MYSPMPIPKPNRRARSNLLLPPILPTLPLVIRILDRTPRLLIGKLVLARVVVILHVLWAMGPGERSVILFGLDIPSCPIGA